jgi:flagellar basal-body rod modification protein FlgD
MSTIPGNQPLGTASTSSSTSTTGTSSTSTNGFGSLTTGDFMQMLIAELEDQDPTQPMSSQDLLSQLATMSQLQSTTQLDQALTNNTTNQQLSQAAALIGDTISGTDVNNNAANGVVSQALLQNGTAYVVVGSQQVPLANITGVTGTAASSLSNLL